jgi:hypothetical protein
MSHLPLKVWHFPLRKVQAQVSPLFWPQHAKSSPDTNQNREIWHSWPCHSLPAKCQSNLDRESNLMQPTCVCWRVDGLQCDVWCADDLISHKLLYCLLLNSFAFVIFFALKSLKTRWCVLCFEAYLMCWNRRSLTPLLLETQSKFSPARFAELARFLPNLRVSRVKYPPNDIQCVAKVWSQDWEWVVFKKPLSTLPHHLFLL